MRSVMFKAQTDQLERFVKITYILPSDIELSYWKSQDALQQKKKTKITHA